MTALTQDPAASATATPAGGIPFSRLLRLEFRKSWDTRASFWLLFCIGAIVLLAEFITAIVTGAQDVKDVDYGTFASVTGFVTSILLPVLGIMLVTSEWGQRTAMVTFALEPRRSRVIYAKLWVGLIWTAATVVLALAMGAVFNLLYGAISGQTDWTLGWGGLLGFVLGQSMAMLGGFALAALFLNTPAAIVVYFAYKFALPTLLIIGANLMGWFKSFSEWINFQQAQGPMYDGLWNMTGSEWGRLIVSGLIWLVLPLGVGLWRILRAEVK